MSQAALIEPIRQWIVEQSINGQDITQMFESLCEKVNAAGIPVARGALMWSTLHPLYAAERVLWVRGKETDLHQFPHQDQASDEWKQSPFARVIAQNIDIFRRQLEGPNALLDFPVLEEFKQQGMTDYLLFYTPIEKLPWASNNETRSRGILISWTTDRPGGFTAEDIRSLSNLQGRFAVACKSEIQSRTAINVVQAYLGKRAGGHVMSGQIRRGDGERTCAVLWYSDMRQSTHLSQTMEPEAYLDLLNSYFEAAAGPVEKENGEILDFIGDAVLGIFQFSRDNDAEASSAVEAAIRAAKASREIAREINAQREADGLIGFKYGIGLNLGSIMFGNIGIPQRLSFSAIGKSVNEVARIEKLTKKTGKQIIASDEFVRLSPEGWESLGSFDLDGLDGQMKIHSLL